MTARRSTLLVFGIYCMAHLPLFALGDAAYWDDWILFSPPASDVRETFDELGVPWFGSFHLFMRQWGGFGYHLATFCSFALASLVIQPILRRYRVVDEEQAFWIAVLLAVLPFNEARAAAIVVPYAVCYGLFFLGWYLLAQPSATRQGPVRLAAMACFFAAFSTESFLVYYALPMSLLLMQGDYPWRRRFLRNGDVLILPVLYLGFKSLFPANGAYAGYNGVHLQNVLSSFHFLALITLEGLDWQTPAAALTSLLLLGAVLSIIRNWASIRKELAAYWYAEGAPIPLELAGSIALALGLIPYFIVEKCPSFAGWESRFQLLMPLGYALLVTAAAWRTFSPPSRSHILVMVTIACVSVWVRTYADFYVDWLKQLSIIEELRAKNSLTSTKAFLWVDLTQDMNALNREYRLYDYTGLLNRAYGTQDHYIVSYNRFSKAEGSWEHFVNEDSKSFTSCYMAEDVHNPPPPELLIVTRKAHTYSVDNHVSYAISMLFKRWFMPRKFTDKLHSLISLDGPVMLPTPFSQKPSELPVDERYRDGSGAF